MYKLAILFGVVLSATISRGSEDPAPAVRETTQRVAFSQYCFWTGEMKLGQIDGVLRTEAGFLNGQEVTVVDYDPARLSLEALVRQAKAAGVADLIHFPQQTSPHNLAALGLPEGVSLAGYRPAPAGDQKKQLEGTPYSRLTLTPEQATKLNAFCRQNPAKAREALTREQRAELARRSVH
ncbi:MAG: hypothetical protein ABI992_04380 [Chthoniobacterales bacterium]